MVTNTARGLCVRRAWAGQFTTSVLGLERTRCLLAGAMEGKTLPRVRGGEPMKALMMRTSIRVAVLLTTVAALGAPKKW